MVSSEFRELCDSCFLNAYKTPEFLQMTSFDQSLYLFANIYNTRPIYYPLESMSPNRKFLLDKAGLPTTDLNVDEEATIKKIIEEFLENAYIYDETYYLTEDFMVSLNGYLFLANLDFIDKIESCLIPYTEAKTFGYVSANSNGFTTKQMKISDMTTEETFFDNYNDDLPWEKILNFCEGDRSGIAILHGIAGSGKTSLIRHLITTSSCKFFWLDQSMLGNINNTDFINFLIDHKNAIFIMEDCEYLLHSREQGGNGLISSLLNLSDGILGDSLNIKFLCTFNSDLRQIDKALLRKGRLKIKYEFRELSVDKTNVLLNRLGFESQNKALPLCDIYNYDVNNGNKVKTSKIGF